MLSTNKKQLGLKLAGFGGVLVALSLMVAACAPSPTPTPPATPTKAPTGPLSLAGFANPDLVATTDWLAANLNNTDLRVVDVRAADRYQEGHIPGALSQPVAGLYGPSPDGKVKQLVLTQDKFEALMGSLGVSNTTTVVAVDDSGGTAAGRLLWSLEYYGHAKVRYLDGGFAKWQREGREVTRAVPRVAEAKFTAKPNLAVLATKEQVLAAINKPGTIIVDARTAQEYSGQDLRGNARGGHIPGAVLLDWTQDLTGGPASVLKSAAELKARYEGAGVTKDKEVIVYCQTGTRSSHSYLVLRLLGYEKVRNYDGSWEEWGNDPATPIETASSPSPSY